MVYGIFYLYIYREYGIRHRVYCIGTAQGVG